MMNIAITRLAADDAGTVRLTVAGELCLDTVDRLRQHIKREMAADRPPLRLVIDLAQVAFCDSTGLGALLAAQAVAADRGTDLRVVNPGGMTLRVMEATGLVDVLTGHTPE